MKLNKEFERFYKQVEHISGLEFDMPYRELEFFGVTHKATVKITPTAYCLVQLNELPFFVLTLDTIEVASLERVQHGLRLFDLTFVLKDLTKPVVQITNIPQREHLETIEEWLDECDILYYPNPKNFQWKQIMKTVNADPVGFFEEIGGWPGILDTELSDEDEEGDDDENFEINSDYDEDEDSYEYEDEEEFDNEYADNFDEYEDDEDGIDWEELDKKAEREDRERAKNRKKKGDGYDSDDELHYSEPKRKRQRYR
eukprot:TRINITY_DN5014_c0_g2_i1.p1 TRINITY_DN5014_c0_g2~~TRINITY_DN5014_c0_g2_i1.p1  ORF type:complete len:288 (+),score=142.53 TRINITY_DN5014_c0_g2_i1:99-866(+)